MWTTTPWVTWGIVVVYGVAVVVGGLLSLALCVVAKRADETMTEMIKSGCAGRPRLPANGERGLVVTEPPAMEFRWQPTPYHDVQGRDQAVGLVQRVVASLPDGNFVRSDYVARLAGLPERLVEMVMGDTKLEPYQIQEPEGWWGNALTVEAFRRQAATVECAEGAPLPMPASTSGRRA